MAHVRALLFLVRGKFGRSGDNHVGIRTGSKWDY
jgi:hypothetical protein